MGRATFAIAVGVPRCEAQLADSLMPIADLDSRAQTVILAARRELRPAAGERERLEAMLEARIGALTFEGGPASDQWRLLSPDNVR